MKTVKILFYIISISFVVDKVIYFGMNEISDKVFSGQAIGKLNHFLSIKDTTKVLVMGSSRANHSINPKLIDSSSFNNGVDGSTISYSATLIKTLPAKKQLILLHLDPERIIDSDYSGDDINFLISKYHRNKIIKKEIDDLGQYNPLQRFYWTIDYNSKVLAILKNYFKPKYNYSDYNGFDPIHLNQNHKDILKKKLAQKITAKCPEEILVNKIYMKYLRDIKEVCETYNKRLIVFTSPVYMDSCMADNKLLEETLRELNIPYYDFSNFFKENNSLDYWRDETHLSKDGAMIFSNFFANKIQD